MNLKNILDKHKKHDRKKIFRMIAVLSELENLRESKRKIDIKINRKK